MKYLASHNLFRRPAQRTAALLCAALLGLGLATARTSAQVTGPVTGSPPTPTPFQAPVFHSGGGYGATFPTDTASAPYLDPLIDPLQGQLQGTPTEIYPATAAGVPTQIPSFLLGDYDPTRPPTGLIADGAGGLINVYYPNHFADGSVYNWAAPFVYTLVGNNAVTVDDNAAAPAAGASGFTQTGFASVTDPVAFPSAGTATNGEYLRLASGVPGSAIWTLYQATAGNYSLYFHVPSDLPDANGNPELRDTQVVYSIAVRDANGNVTLTTAATANQIEANDSQFLAGPFLIASGGTVTVTLLRSNTLNTGADFLAADSMTLQPTVGDVQSAPTAITRNRFLAEFASTAHPLQYWGIFVPDGATVTGTLNTTAPTGSTTTAQLNAAANPDTDMAVFDPTGTAAINQGNILLHTGNPATAVNPPTTTNPANPVRLIRQLVYFGRSDPSASVSNSVDDSAGAPGFIGSGSQVGNAPTASNSEYRVSPAGEGLIGVAGSPVATWTVPVPAAGAGTSFFVYAHIPATPNGEVRTTAVYTVTANGTTTGPLVISQKTQGTDALVVLPTGSLQAAAGTSVVVKLYGVNNSTATAPPANAVVVADSVTVSTGTGQGAIYCVDGFNGSVVWRFETPGSANGGSSPVFASPAIARINVLVTPPVYSTTGAITTPAVYANRLVVMVGDNNGLVYCLDAIGNGDGTSNVNVLAKDANGNPIPSQPVTIPQPAYGGAYGAVAAPLAAGTPAAMAATTAHVGTTGVYWIYRPDATRPKFVSGTNVGKVKTVDPTTDLPVPAAFGTASPNVFVDPTVSTTPDATGSLLSNAKVYIGNTNGVLYALDALGVAINGTSPDSAAAPGNATSTLAFAATGDTFNVSQDLQSGLAVRIPSCQPLWWFSLRGVDPNGAANTSSADIESAPAIHVTATGTGAATTYVPTVYIGSAHEQGVTSNIGRVYALNGLYGPSFNNGRTSPVPTATRYAPPGSFNYNIGQVPQTDANDAADWSFPDGNTTTGSNNPLSGFKHQSSNGSARPALGNITGSPVVFTNTDDTAAVQTRLYFAANSGKEYPAVDRPDDTQTGRLWAVNLDGSIGHTAKSGTGGNVWAYPLANDPNNATLDVTAEPVPPIGSFLRGTPAIGFVQFPNVTTNGDGTTYNPADAVHTGGISGFAVPMLYIGTRGANDTALYAVNIDGDETAASDQRTIYRLISPNGSIYQSSPALITNATINNTGTGGTNNGNGGAVYAVAGNTMYDYSATPISNPFAGQAYPLIRLDREFVGVGPISSPALAGADVSDFASAAAFIGTAANPVQVPGTTNTSAFKTLDTDWIYVGDSSSGFCRGITPFDTSYGGIPIELNQIIPYSPDFIQTPPLDTFIQTYLVDIQTSTSSADAKRVGLDAPLPVYEWGQNAYLRFTNAVPPNLPDKATGKLNPALFVYDTLKYTDLTVATKTDPIPFYTADGTTAETITFNLSDTDVTAGSILQQTGSQQVQPRLITTPPDGFVLDAAATTAYPTFFTKNVTNLATTAGNHYLGTYTYPVGDSSPLGSTPGARRRVLNVQQTVSEYDYQGDVNGNGLTNPDNYVFKAKVISGTGSAVGENLITQIDPVTKKPTFNANSRVAAVDQPTFGILNPLGVRGGGLNLLAPTVIGAVPIGDGTNYNGDAVGPFRSVQSPPTLSTTGGTTTTVAGDSFALQALANGNAVPTVAPPSSSGAGGNPTVLANGANDPTGVSTPTTQAVVVTATGLIPHNSVNDNEEISAAPTGQFANTTSNGLQSAGFGGYSLNIFDRSDLFTLGQSLRLKMTIPSNVQFAPPAGRDGMYWNSNAPLTGYGNSGHESVVNFLPWETQPTPYAVGSPNPSLDYPDIFSGNIIQNATSVLNGASPGDLSSNSVSLPPATGTASTPASRVMYGDPVQIKITVPHYQPANQQLYQQSIGDKYTPAGVGTVPHEISPVNAAGTNQITLSQAFPMGYVTTKRLYVPTVTGGYSQQRPYRDVRIYTGVPVDMRTSIANPTTDIGKVPAAFGVQTEQYAPTANPPVYPLGYFTPYPLLPSGVPNPFQSYFKPLEVHNDGNVNLLNAHFDQKISAGGSVTLRLTSDAVDPLSSLLGYDLYGVTGPRGTLPLSNNVAEQQYLIRTSLDTDLFSAYGHNPAIAQNQQFPGEPTSTNIAAMYPGATFHKPLVGSDQPSTLTIPDAPESYVAGASLPSSPTPVQPSNGALAAKSAPFVSIAFPFGTPVGTYSTPSGQQFGSLQLFEGLDTGFGSYNLVPPTNANPIPNILYPPRYKGYIGGIGSPGTASTLPDIYIPNAQPISTTGTQLTGTVIEGRLTDGNTYGAVPMIDAGPAGSVKNANGTTVPASTPDFAPAAFRDPKSGNLSAYWTSGRGTGFSIYGANALFTTDATGAYFFPQDVTQYWWKSIGGYGSGTPAPLVPVLASTTSPQASNSGLSVLAEPTANGTSFDAFGVYNSNAPYTNILYRYPVTPDTGALGTAARVSPPSDDSLVKYGVKGLYGSPGDPHFANPLWAFWTANTRGRTALYYSPQSLWGTASSVLPVPAGLTSVADASPLLMTVPYYDIPGVYGTAGALVYKPTIEVTYSGTGPDGNADLYVSRYLPHLKANAQDTEPTTHLDLVPFPAVTENLRLQGSTGWYQGRDTAWSRSGALNVSLVYTDARGQQNPSLLYGTNTPFAPKFTKAIYDKASGYLVLTGVQVPIILTTANGTQAYTTNTVYVDAATGRIRFSPALLPTQTFGSIQATFSPLARRLTTDTRADVAPVTFLDDTPKPNDGPGLAPVNASRRWTIWRKSGVPGLTSTATLYFKTQRLTLFLPNAIGLSNPAAPAIPAPLLTSVTVNGTDVTNQVDVDYLRGRIYFPIGLSAEGQTATVTYTDTNGTAHTGTTGPTPAVTDTVQWQDEAPANSLATSGEVLPTNTVSGLDTVIDTLVPIQTATNENNVTAFLDPYAGTPAAYGGLNSHKVWLFWNSTRNGTADIYSETIDPRFAPSPTIP